MRKIYDSRAFWIIVSVLASLALWVYVTSVDGEEITQVFRGIQVELVGDDTLRDSKGMVITDMETSTVNVQISGPRRVVGMLDAEDLMAQVDVTKLSRSSYTSQPYKIVYPSGIDTRDLVVSGKTPETVNFVVSAQTSKSIPVRGSFDGQMAEGYTAETPVFEPATVTLSGAEAYLKNIEYAWVSFGGDQDEISSTYEAETGYTLMNKNGEPCQTTGIEFSADVITARLPVLMIKEVPLAVNIIEGAGATAENTVVKIEPESILLVGDSKLLGGMNKIILDTIDLTRFTSGYTNEYNIVLDNDVNNITGVKTAKVSVQIAGLTTKVFNVRNLSHINVTDGYEATILSESLPVTLRGQAETLATIRDENLRAVADLADYDASTGTYMSAVTIHVDGFSDVGAIGDYTVSVEIRKVNG